MAISIAFFGLGVGSLIAHIGKMRVPREKIPFLLLKSSLGFAVTVVVFLLLASYIIPPSVDYLYLFYLASSLPFIFGGFTIALIFYSTPKDISRLYFYDLMGSAAATLLLDPLLRGLGAESTLIFISLMLSATCLLGFSMLARKKEYANTFGSKSSRFAILNSLPSIVRETSGVQIRVLAITLGLIIILSLVLTLNSSHKGLISVKPGQDKGLYFQLLNRSAFEHLYTEWNSFSRIDVTRQIHDPVLSQDSELTGRSRSLAAVAIDADADTPVMRWNGTSPDLEWIKRYMDFLPYEIIKPNSTLVIGSGGGEDVLTALAGGSKNITAVEINPLIIEAAKRFGESAGNLYEREEVDLVIDEGRRYLSGTNSEFDLIVIKLVDSWAAQLAGAYALSENYLYTIEAFKQYLEHLDENHGILVLIRWNIELPRLVPLIYESLREVNSEKQGGEELYNSSRGLASANQDVLNKVVIVENKPGLYFLPTGEGSIYPVIVMIKKSGFTPSEIEAAKQRVNQRESRTIVLPDEYAETPYGEILSGNLSTGDIGRIYDAAFKLPVPTDDSPFFFARERIPSQLLTLLATVLVLSAVLIILLLYYSKLNRIDTARAMSSSRHYLLFAAFIGFGFMFFEIILIQKFLLILGTPVLALTAILFSILISTGIGSYASGKIFRNRPDKAILLSMPFLFALAIAYYFVLDHAIYQSISLPVYERISVTLVFLLPIGFFMGFQFPSITRLASGEGRSEHDTRQSLTYSKNIAESKTVSLEKQDNTDGHNITLIWGVNIIASVIGSVLAVISSMALGLNDTLLMGFGFYVAALGILLLKLQQSRTNKHNPSLEK